MIDELWVVNAFAAQGLKGNPAGVCFVDEFPTKNSQMLDISKRLGFSNSAFVQHIQDNKFQIRWFTPHSEAPICGHATIAASHIIHQKQLCNPNEELVFESMSGELYVTKTEEWYNLNFPTYSDLQEKEVSDEIIKLIGYKPIFNGVYGKGLYIELPSEDALKKFSPDLEFLKTFDCRALTITARAADAAEYDFVSRYFAPSVGIDEDPVCASAHCALIPYWSRKLGEKDLIAYQASERGGMVKCKDLGNRVLISGKAETTFEGNIKNLFSEKISI